MKQNLSFGFNTDNYNVVIETITTDNGNFICNFTRVLPDLEIDSPKDDLHIDKSFFANSSNITIYAFDSFEDFISFCSFFEQNFFGNKNIFSDNSKLVFYESAFYLIIYDVYTNLDDLRNFCACISEFADFISSSNFLAEKILEYGSLIINSNAILDISIKFKLI